MNEGVSEENLALLEREGWSTGNLSPEMQAEFNRLLDAARAEGPAPPGGGGEEDYRGSLRSAPGSTSHRTGGAGECSKAAADVLAERRRQVEVEGWTPEHDDQHRSGHLSAAGAVYAMAGSYAGRSAWDHGQAPCVEEQVWPWPWAWFKPKDRRRDLVRGAALIVAEIERLDRAALTQPETP